MMYVANPVEFWFFQVEPFTSSGHIYRNRKTLQNTALAATHVGPTNPFWRPAPNIHDGRC